MVSQVTMEISALSSATRSSLVALPNQPFTRLLRSCRLFPVATTGPLHQAHLRFLPPPVAAAYYSSSADNQTEVGHHPPAEEVVRSFYGGINRRDLSAVEGLIADDCVYEDLVFPNPMVGRKAVLQFFQSFIDDISADLQFVIDDITTEDSSAVGVTWHLEWKGKPFPFSRGCSFYRLRVIQGKRQITYGRDIVEPAIKPGEAALVIIRGVTWLFQRFPQLADVL